MENKTEEGDAAPQRKRRSAYKFIKVPIFDLDDAVRLIDTISRNGGDRLDIGSLARSLGNTESTCSHHVNSAKHYGLVEKKEDMVHLTSLGHSISSPTSENEKRDGLEKAFLSCKIYRKYLERYSGKNLPAIEILGNIFFREDGVAASTKDRTANNFISSGLTAGLIDEQDGMYRSVSLGSNEDSQAPEPSHKTLGDVTTQAVDEKVSLGLGGAEEAKAPTAHIQELSDARTIVVEPFFVLKIASEERAFEVLEQLLPHYKKVYLDTEAESS